MLPAFVNTQYRKEFDQGITEMAATGKQRKVDPAALAHDVESVECGND
jgi:IclR family KDG regulon transcriptional repressor